VLIVYLVDEWYKTYMPGADPVGWIAHAAVQSTDRKGQTRKGFEAHECWIRISVV